MIEAHAAESGRALPNADQTGRIDVIPTTANARDSLRTAANGTRRRRAQQLNVCVVGLIVTVGSAFYVSEAGQEQSPVIAADQAFQARSVVIGNADAKDERMEKPLPDRSRTVGAEQGINDDGIENKNASGADSNDTVVVTPVVGQPMEKPLQAGEPDRSGTVGVEERVDEDGIGIKSTSGADSNDRPAVTPVVRQPIEKLGSETANRADGAAVARLPTEAVRTDPVAAAPKPSTEESSRRDALLSPPLARETGSAIDRAKGPVAMQVARVVSGSNMRAGPSKGQPVLATIPRGSSIEVIKCRDWCEVSFGGQRGWVYKTSIRAPLADGATLPDRTKPSPRKAGSNRGALRGTRTRASVPHRPKPATARRFADQSTRDARSRAQSSSSNSPIFWAPFEYLWNQLRPTAVWPNSD